MTQGVTLNDGLKNFALSDGEVARITELDTGSSAFFDHRDPAMVRRLNATRS